MIACGPNGSAKHAQAPRSAGSWTLARMMIRANTMRFLVLAMLLVACEGPAGPAGTNGSNGLPGSNGSTGDAGTTGSAGQAPWLTSPGVAIDITGITFGAGGATVAFTLTDGNGVGLDRSGLLTDGVVATSFVMSQ